MNNEQRTQTDSNGSPRWFRGPLKNLTIFTTFTKVSFVTYTIKSWVVVIGWTQSFAHTWQGRTWICRKKLNIAVGQKCHSQNRANWGVFTKIGYLSGALEMHYDSSHFYKTHQVPKNLNIQLISVIYRVLTIRESKFQSGNND